MAHDAVKTVKLIDMLKDVWGKKTSDTIYNYWNHTGWRAPQEPRAADPPAFTAHDNFSDEGWESSVYQDAETVGNLNDVVKRRRIDSQTAANDEYDEDNAPVAHISRLDVH